VVSIPERVLRGCPVVTGSGVFRRLSLICLFRRVFGFAARPRDQVRVEVEGVHPAADDPRKRRDEIPVAAAPIERRLSSLTPSVRSKREGSGKRAAHQSWDGIDVPANMCGPKMNST
jgi:hypothetical protein